MILRLPYKTKQFFVVLIKLCIVVGAFYFIYCKLIENDTLDFHVFIDYLNKKEVFSLKNILFLIIFSIFNWFLEIFKWSTLVNSITKISFKDALEQSLGALTASLFTPNRIGEYGAKAIYYPKLLQKKIMLLNLISNMMQMSTTIIFGLIGLLFFANYYSLGLDFIRFFFFALFMMLILFIAIYTFKRNTFKIKGFSFKKIRGFVNGISREIKVKAFVLSVLRYLIFSFQMYCLLIIFGANMNYLNAMMVITSMYLVSSVIPSIFMFDVVIKSGVAVYLFSIIGVDELSILSIITIMWLLNFVIPSVFGSYFVLNFNFPESDNHL